MKRMLVLILSTVILIASIFSVSYAWFTYIETKAVATLTAGEIDLELKANQMLVLDDFSLDNLAFIDYQDDLIDNLSDSFDEMALTLRLDFKASQNSVLIKNRIELIEHSTSDALIYLILFEGMNLGIEDEVSSQFHFIIQNIISGYVTKEEQLQAIKLYNAAVLESIESIILRPEESITLQIVFYGDYDALVEGEDYLDIDFPFTMIVETVNSKGDFQ